MALQESFELSDGTGWATYGSTAWSFQTWTTTSAYSITDVALYGYKYGSPGNITVSIREVDTETGKPTGADKCSVTVSDSVISAFPTRAWYTFTFTTSYALSDATKYAIVIRATSGNAANYYAPFGYGSSGYANGESGQGNGSTWGTPSTTNDMDFRIYGAALVPGKPTNPSPTHEATNITLDETPLSWDASDPAADTYEIYFREQGDDWELVGEAQAGTEWAISFGTLGYNKTYEWRIDATNVYGTTTGDTWDFGSISYAPPLPTGITLDGSGEGDGNPTGTPTGENNMFTIKRLIIAANNKIYYEDI